MYYSNEGLNVFLTCGVGDFIAVESHLTDQEKQEVSKIFYATRQEKTIKELVSFCFPNIISQETLVSEFGEPYTNNFCFTSLYDLNKKTGISIDTKKVADWGIYKIFTQIARGKRFYNKSSLIEKTLCHLTTRLPDKYIVIHPYSDNQPTPTRDLLVPEWNAIIEMLQDIQLPAIVINKGSRPIPENKLIINLQNKTTVLQSIEIIKQAYAFIGSASWPSVVVSKIVPKRKLLIKGDQNLKGINYKYYYAPLNGSKYIQPRITPTTLKMFGRKLIHE